MAKLGQIYNLDSFDSAKNYFKSLDSNGGTVLARNLEHISSDVFEQRIAGLSFLTASGIVINNDAGNKPFFFPVTIGHSVVYRLAAARTVGKIDSIPQMSK